MFSLAKKLIMPPSQNEVLFVGSKSGQTNGNSSVNLTLSGLSGGIASSAAVGDLVVPVMARITAKTGASGVVFIPYPSTSGGDTVVKTNWIWGTYLGSGAGHPQVNVPMGRLLFGYGWSVLTAQNYNKTMNCQFAESYEELEGVPQAGPTTVLLFVFRNAHPTNPIAHHQLNTATSGYGITPSVSNSYRGSRFIAATMAPLRVAGDITTTPSGYAALTKLNVADINGNFKHVAAAVQNKVGVTTTPSVSFTGSPSQSNNYPITATICIRPAT